MRGRLRAIICAVVAVVIVVTWIAEPPDTAASIGLAIVFVAMLVVIAQELRRAS
jgi:hypothetical protein